MTKWSQLFGKHGICIGISGASHLTSMTRVVEGLQRSKLCAITSDKDRDLNNAGSLFVYSAQCSNLLQLSSVV